ncbi:MAG: Crp/Fnr family transcriptional regulator [Betaproteobacteria bacterium]|nr:Crp/Fnr family transcriptional regulator [Betaproteobacteria bacterium]
MSGKDKTASEFVLSAEELRAISAHAQTRAFPRNAVVLNEGDHTDSLYIILEGRVKAFVSDPDGKEVVLSTQAAGEYFGEMVLDEGPRSASVMTLEPSKFLIVPKADFKDFLLKNPVFAVRVIEKLIHRVRALTENVKSLALMDVYGRVARLLLELAKDEGGKLVIREKLTQQDIASRVGASREMISKIFKDLSTGGYISVEQKHITINKTPPRHW